MKEIDTLPYKVVKRYFRDNPIPLAAHDLFRQPRRYFYQDNFVVCLIGEGKYVYVGVAKRNPCDNFSKETGESVALARAYRSFLRDLIPKD